MVSVSPGWELDVERGPDCLFVRPQNVPADRKAIDVDDAPQLAEAVWALLEQNFTHRLVLELDRVELLRSYLIGQLILLQKRICAHDGLMRICGLSGANYESLEHCGLGSHFPQYATRNEAVMAQSTGAAALERKVGLSSASHGLYVRGLDRIASGAAS